jgi:hypothetical protein
MKTFRLVAFLAFISLAGTASASNQWAHPHPYFHPRWNVGYYGPRVLLPPPLPLPLPVALPYYGPCYGGGYYRHGYCGHGGYYGHGGGRCGGGHYGHRR